jgi:hypothetical protein
MTRIVVTPAAQDQVSREVQGWYEHRPKNPFLFEDELAAAPDVLSYSPGAGLIFAPRLRVRRYLLSGAGYHV